MCDFLLQLKNGCTRLESVSEVAVEVITQTGPSPKPQEERDTNQVRIYTIQDRHCTKRIQCQCSPGVSTIQFSFHCVCTFIYIQHNALVVRSGC